MAAALKLGVFDETAGPTSWHDWLRQWHADAMPVNGRFRGERNGEWVAPSAMPGTRVRNLQSTLKVLEFLPHAQPDGIFDYRTQSATRLFQEYVRSVEGHDDIGTPDGVVGTLTQSHLDRWERDGARPYWAGTDVAMGTAEFNYWMKVMELFKDAIAEDPLPRSVELAESYAGSCDTRKIRDWSFGVEGIHLIGIRREEWKKTQVRRNDDLFVLLVNGLAFKFFGSTDPSATMAKRPDEPFIVRGQHRYRFGWHKQSESDRVYRALRPAGPGVLVCRDFVRDDAFTDGDLGGGLEPNNTINVHWSGAGTSNWSAGCQVIAGRRYIDGHGRLADCASHAASGYVELPGKTRGAYNVLIDLLTVLAPDPSTRNGSTIDFMLIYESDLETEVGAGQTLAAAALANVTDLPGGGALGDSVSTAALAARLFDP